MSGSIKPENAPQILLSVSDSLELVYFLDLPALQPAGLRRKIEFLRHHMCRVCAKGEMLDTRHLKGKLPVVPINDSVAFAHSQVLLSSSCRVQSNRQGDIRNTSGQQSTKRREIRITGAICYPASKSKFSRKKKKVSRRSTQLKSFWSLLGETVITAERH